MKTHRPQGRDFSEVLSQRVQKQPKALVDYQKKLVGSPWFGEDGKALKYTFLKCRRVGGSEAGAIRSLCYLLGRELLYGVHGGEFDGDYRRQTPMPGIVVSKDWAGAKDFISKVRDNVFEWAAAGDEECQQAIPYCHETKIQFPSTGTKIEAIACSPAAIRGKTGFAILDEFAFARQQEDLWGAAKVVTDANLGNPRGYPLFAISTPWESGSFAHRIFTDPSFPFAKNRFSVDIYQAVADGFPIDPKTAFAELGIPELIETEYLCKWARGGEAFFAMDKLRACTVDDSGTDEDPLACGLPLFWERAPCRIGIDCGGGVGRDFTAAVMWRLIEGRWWMVGILASNSTPTVEMADLVGSWIIDKKIVDPTVQVDIRCDQGVMGADFIRQLRKKIGERKRITIQGVGMTSPEQESYALSGRKLLERGQMAIYLGLEAVRDYVDLDKQTDNGSHALMLELGKLKARRGQGGTLLFTTPRDTTRGHCDRAWASLIGLEGAEIGLGYGLSKDQQSKLYDSEPSVWGDEARGFG